MATCSAVTKNGSTVLVCDLPHGHPGDHATFYGAAKVTWPQEQW